MSDDELTEDIEKAISKALAYRQVSLRKFREVALKHKDTDLASSYDKRLKINGDAQRWILKMWQNKINNSDEALTR